MNPSASERPDILGMSEAELRAKGATWLAEQMERLRERQMELLAGVNEPDPRHWEG